MHTVKRAEFNLWWCLLLLVVLRSDAHSVNALKDHFAQVRFAWSENERKWQTDRVTCWCECLRVSDHGAARVWLGFCLTHFWARAPVGDPESWQDRPRAGGLRVKAAGRARPESLGQVIIDGSERNPEGGCHGYHQTGPGHRFSNRCFRYWLFKTLFVWT